MRAAETVLKTRLLVRFEVLNYEYPLEEDVPPHPFPGALLSAIDLIEEIERNLERDSTNGPDGGMGMPSPSARFGTARQRSKFPSQVDALRGGFRRIPRGQRGSGLLAAAAGNFQRRSIERTCPDVRGRCEDRRGLGCPLHDGC